MDDRTSTHAGKLFLYDMPTPLPFPAQHVDSRMRAKIKTLGHGLRAGSGCLAAREGVSIPGPFWAWTRRGWVPSGTLEGRGTFTMCCRTMAEGLGLCQAPGSAAHGLEGRADRSPFPFARDGRQSPFKPVSTCRLICLQILSTARASSRGCS